MFARYYFHKHGDGFLPFAERINRKIEQIVDTSLVIGKFGVVLDAEFFHARFFVRFSERDEKFFKRGALVAGTLLRIALFHKFFGFGRKRSDAVFDRGFYRRKFVFGGLSRAVFFGEFYHLCRDEISQGVTDFEAFVFDVYLFDFARFRVFAPVHVGAFAIPLRIRKEFGCDFSVLDVFRHELKGNGYGQSLVFEYRHG